MIQSVEQPAAIFFDPRESLGNSLPLSFVRFFEAFAAVRGHVCALEHSDELGGENFVYAERLGQVANGDFAGSGKVIEECAASGMAECPKKQIQPLIAIHDNSL